MSNEKLPEEIQPTFERFYQNDPAKTVKLSKGVSLDSYGIKKDGGKGYYFNKYRAQTKLLIINEKSKTIQDFILKNNKRLLKKKRNEFLRKLLDKTEFIFL